MHALARLACANQMLSLSLKFDKDSRVFSWKP